MVRAFDERRRHIVAALNRLPGIRTVMPGGAFYVFPNIVGTGLSSRELQARLLDEAGIATIAGTSFGAGGEGYLRLSYAASLDAIDEAVRRFGTFLAGLAR
jgi:aspartate/methionine/tyrosine aminotransferase